MVPPKAQVADKREAILAAALDLFSERGFDGTAMPMVAERAGVGAGTIYRHFDSKEALGNAVFRQCKLAMQDYVLARRKAGLTAREEFRGMWQGLWDFLREQPAACRFLETQGHATYLDESSRAISDAVIIAMALGAFIGLVKEADAGRFSLDDSVIEEGELLIWDLVHA